MSSYRRRNGEEGCLFGQFFGHWLLVEAGAIKAQVRTVVRPDEAEFARRY